MTQVSTRAEAHAATTTRIVAAARALVARDAPVTLRAVARKLGLTAPALYRYAPSHEELVRMVAIAIDADVAGRITAAADRQPADDPAARLIGAAVGMAVIVGERRRVHRVRIRDASGQRALRSGAGVGLDGDVRTLLNLIWLIFGGLWLAIGYFFAGIVACIFIITIPFGIASFRMASYALWPFGRTVVSKPTAGVGSALGNVIWVVLAGWWLAIGHIVSGIAMCVTIIGIPMGIADFKLVPVSLMPLGKEIVSSR